ncbi:hypothetical protein JZ751_002631 [Albula glossodonta]|uniref:Uncharacterized protein n=1 Tax=Albula glossodonta TaxID=121402 RepID=A0A8T2N8L2_9TELE|nr:hypothetical protein JZ751_002631 [Albula glossodonta]
MGLLSSSPRSLYLSSSCPSGSSLGLASHTSEPPAHCSRETEDKAPGHREHTRLTSGDTRQSHWPRGGAFCQVDIIGEADGPAEMRLQQWSAADRGAPLSHLQSRLSSEDGSSTQACMSMWQLYGAPWQAPYPSTTTDKNAVRVERPSRGRTVSN